MERPATVLVSIDNFGRTYRRGPRHDRHLRRSPGIASARRRGPHVCFAACKPQNREHGAFEGKVAAIANPTSARGSRMIPEDV